MPVVMDEKKYGRLVAKHLPAVIETDEEQDRLAEILMRMTIPRRDLPAEEAITKSSCTPALLENVRRPPILAERSNMTLRRRVI